MGNIEVIDAWGFVEAEAAARVRLQPAPFCPHTPHPRQQTFLDCDELEAFFGGAASGGKTDALLMAALKYVHVPGYTALILMKTFADLSKPGALMDRAHGWLQGTGAEWSEKYRRWTFPNVAGAPAKMDFGYLQNDMDKYQYRTAEYQYIGIDELTRFAQQTYTYLFSRLRKPEGMPVPIRMRSASNPAQPGELGMLWVEERFIPDEFDPEAEAQLPPRLIYKEGYTDEGEPTKRIFVFSRKSDNPSVDQAAYDLSLRELDPISRAQLERGDWKIRFKGDIYWMWDEDDHVITWDEFEAVYGTRSIPAHWRKTVSQDQGTSDGHPCATGWFAMPAANAPYQDTAFLYRSMTRTHTGPSEMAEEMLAAMVKVKESTGRIMDDMRNSQIIYDERSQVDYWINSHEAKSERLEYFKYDMPFSDWTQGPNIGIAQVRARLRIIEKHTEACKDSECKGCRPSPWNKDRFGRPRFLVIVDATERKHAKTDAGQALVRAEFPAYHYKKNKSGEPVQGAVVPHAFFNDHMDQIREACYDALPHVAPLSDDEYIESQLPNNLKREAVAAKQGTESFQGAEDRREFEVRRIVDSRAATGVYDDVERYRLIREGKMGAPGSNWPFN